MTETEYAGEDSDLAKFKRWYREDFDASLEWRKEAVIDYAMYAGHGQWDEADRNRLRGQNRPCITFNRIMPVVASVVGQEINNRAELTFKPRTTQTAMGQPGMLPIPGADDQGFAETLSAAAKYLKDQCNAEDEESDAFQDDVICGMGWVETLVSHDDNPDGDLVENRIDPLEMVWDCKAEKRNVMDARRIWRVREIDKDAARDQFPDFDISDLDATWARMDKTTQPHDREAARYYDSEQGEDYDPNRRTVTQVECAYFVWKTAYKAAKFDNPDESVEFDSKKEAENYAKNVFTMTRQQVPVSTHRKRVYMKAIIGRKVLVNEEAQSQKKFKYQAMTGYRDRNKKQWIGLVRAMRDPQQWANALFSSVLHQIQTTGKGIMAERGAFENSQQAEKDWANGSKIVWLNTGAVAGQMIQQKDQHALPQGVFDMMQLSLGAFRDVTGVNIEAMGLADRQQAASLEYQRTKQAGVILAPFFDGKRRFTKDNGRLVMDLIRNFLSDGRLVRVVGPDYERYVPLVRDDEAIEYDIIVDESPASPNQKEASWAILQQLLPVIGKNLTPATGAILLKGSPLPESLVNEFKKAAQKEAEAAAKQPNPEMLKIRGEMQKQQMQMQMDQAKGQQDMALAQQQGQLDAQKAQAELILKSLDIQMKDKEIRLAEFQAGADMQMKRQEMGFKQQEMEGKAQEGQAQRDHETQMRQMEIDAVDSQETMKMFGKDFPDKIDKAIANQGQAMEVLARAITQLAEAISSDRVTEMADPVTGQKMSAVSRVARAAQAN